MKKQMGNNWNSQGLRRAAGCLLLHCFCLGAVWAQGPPPPPPLPPPPNTAAAPAGSRTGTISGRVQSEDGGPAAYASVGASSASGGGQFVNRSVTADAEGAFSLRDLPARSYRLSASLPGYVSNNDPLESGRYRIGETVTLNLVKGGVITGRVTNHAGEPVIAAPISVMRVRDAEGKVVSGPMGGSLRMTDDQGVYRIYGLRPGSYLVGVNNTGSGFSMGGLASPYDGDTPVYYPASTRDTAQEVQVTPGAVVSGIDIRYRSEAGRTLSGKISGAFESGGGIIFYGQLFLRQAATGITFAMGNAYLSSPESGYELRGIVDGDYEILASLNNNKNGAASVPRRVSVRGADVSGLDLVLAPLATLSGRVVLEPAPSQPDAKKCTPKRPASLEEVQLRVQREEQKPAEAFTTSLGSSEASPDDKGAFTISNLQGSRYRLLADLPSETWYLKSILAGNPAPGASRRPAPATAAAVSSNLFTVKAGDKLANITLTLTDGAAALQGRLTSANASAKLTRRYRVHLVPAEAAQAEEVLRYYEAPVRADGSFQMQHLAPGKYWLVTRPLPDDISSERPARPLAWEQAERTKLRRDAEAAKHELELTACQRLTDYKVTAK